MTEEGEGNRDMPQTLDKGINEQKVKSASGGLETGRDYLETK